MKKLKLLLLLLFATQLLWAQPQVYVKGTDVTNYVTTLENQVVIIPSLNATITALESQVATIPGLNATVLSLNSIISNLNSNVASLTQANILQAFQINDLNKQLIKCDSLKPPITTIFEGFGNNKGAYETTNTPTILIVNILDQESVQTGVNTGSLRWCISQTYPRVIKFTVSGVIDLTSFLRVSNPYVTILGQTSPSGITLKRNPLEIQTHHVVIQNLKLRVGSEMPGQALGDRDALRIYNGAFKVVIDHCSISWGCDENVDIHGTPPPYDITISNCIIGEALLWSPGYSFGMLIEENVKNLSLIKNLDIHNLNRNPLIGDASSAEVINCLIYDNKYQGIDFKNADVSIKGCVKINGINAAWGNGYIARARSGSTIQSVYLQDNISISGFLNESGMCRILTIPIVDSKNYILLKANDLENYLIGNVGAFNWSRDNVDFRLINELKTRTGTYKTHE